MIRKSILHQLGLVNPQSDTVHILKETAHTEMHANLAQTLEKGTGGFSPFAASGSSPKDLAVFTDGSAINNGKINAKGGFAVVFPDYPEYTRAFPLKGQHVTNNRAEYMGFIRALEFADQIDETKKRRLVVYTDSNLLIQSVTKWMHNWRQNGWKKQDGKPVQNRDLLEQMITLMRTRRVIFHHVMAHTGKTDWQHKWNDVADQMAKKAASSGSSSGSYGSYLENAPMNV